MQSIYSLGIFFYGLVIRIAALFIPKARQWVSGRKHLFTRLEAEISKKKNWIWIHVSSLGEFEQGRPLIEKLRSTYPEHGILLTFFSPSGYLIRKNYAQADSVTYMPLDTASHARRFIGIVRPVAAIFVKYDIWYHHLIALEHSHTPTFLVSANLSDRHFYFRRYGQFIEQRLRNLQHIFTQTEESARYLTARGFRNVTCAGDTRVDRVLSIAESPKDFQWLKKCLGDRKIVVAGSTWPADEARLLPAVTDSGYGLVIAPHEIHETRVQEILNNLPGSKRMSELRTNQAPATHIIVDTIGDLAHLYAIADVTYVGGGYGKGIHNILEPAAHRKPVLFGPHYHAFPEAVELIRLGAARSVNSTEEVRVALSDFSNESILESIRTSIAAYLEKQRGATERVMRKIIEIQSKLQWQ